MGVVVVFLRKNEENLITATLLPSRTPGNWRRRGRRALNYSPVHADEMSSLRLLIGLPRRPAARRLAGGPLARLSLLARALRARAPFSFTQSRGRAQFSLVSLFNFFSERWKNTHFVKRRGRFWARFNFFLFSPCCLLGSLKTGIILLHRNYYFKICSSKIWLFCKRYNGWSVMLKLYNRSQ